MRGPTTADNGGTERTSASGGSTPTEMVIRYKIGGAAANDHLWNERCSLCSYAHRHTVPTTATGRVFERHPRCKPSATYVLLVVKTVPAATPLRVPGQRRRGAA
jgi:hypothetical protein